MKIEDCKTLPEFFGVEVGDYIWVEGEEFLVMKDYLSGRDSTFQKDGQALLGCLTGQLEWSKEPPKPEITEDEEFGNCKRCGYEFNSELISEYEIEYCPKCGQKIEEATEETIVPAMTAEEENLLREVAAWFPHLRLMKAPRERLRLDSVGNIVAAYENGVVFHPLGWKTADSKAYEVLAPILEKYGEIDLGDYRKGNA